MTKASKRSQRVRDIMEQLPPPQAQALLEYAEFLLVRYGTAPAVEPAPQILPRPAGESVVAAIKRLRASYPMLDAAKLLDETASLMSEHVLRGRAAGDVIDALEQLFRRHYQLHIAAPTE